MSTVGFMLTIWNFFFFFFFYNLSCICLISQLWCALPSTCLLTGSHPTWRSCKYPHVSMTAVEWRWRLTPASTWSQQPEACQWLQQPATVYADILSIMFPTLLDMLTMFILMMLKHFCHHYLAQTLILILTIPRRLRIHLSWIMSHVSHTIPWCFFTQHILFSHVIGLYQCIVLTCKFL